MRYVHGYMTVSPQMANEIARNRCQDNADMRYALTEERADCVCGLHDGKPPLSPLLTMSDEEYAEWAERLDEMGY